MPIVPQPNHQSGDYPDTVRHISNGDPANDIFLGYPTLDLEFRTDVLKDANNALEITVGNNLNSLSSFDLNHDHGGGNGEKILDFSQIYDNSSAVDAGFSLSVAGQFFIKKSGAGADLFRVVEDGALPKDQVIFPGSVSLHAHMNAAASDLTLSPHNLKLKGRLQPLSLGCFVDGGTNGPYTEIVLDTAASIGQLFAAPSLVSKISSDGVSTEGVLVGDLTSPLLHKDNIILIHDASSDLPILVGPDPVYGLLQDLNIGGAPIWELSFFVNGVMYSFSTDTTLKMYGNESYSLTNIKIVDESFIYKCQTGIDI